MGERVSAGAGASGVGAREEEAGEERTAACAVMDAVCVRVPAEPKAIDDADAADEDAVAGIEATPERPDANDDEGTDEETKAEEDGDAEADEAGEPSASCCNRSATICCRRSFAPFAGAGGTRIEQSVARGEGMGDVASSSALSLPPLEADAGKSGCASASGERAAGCSRGESNLEVGIAMLRGVEEESAGESEKEEEDGRRSREDSTWAAATDSEEDDNEEGSGAVMTMVLGSAGASRDEELVTKSAEDDASVAGAATAPAVALALEAGVTRSEEASCCSARSRSFSFISTSSASALSIVNAFMSSVSG